ncbi:MAG: hypothetical protein M2R45_01997 [Verrucomicrobia subdivision 3 bacterium]|nr:hypothetical protein [Limisphaerales bacterium]MCS1414815.1 hypothetical protein [Limisphaerales bacterium]
MRSVAKSRIATRVTGASLEILFLLLTLTAYSLDFHKWWHGGETPHL